MILERASLIVRQAGGLGWAAWSVILLVGLVLLPLACRIAAVWAAETVPGWAMARWDSAGLAPDPAMTPEPVIQFYAARTWGWRGILGVHSWVSFKPRGATSYTRYEVVGWGVGPGVPAIRVSPRPPDGYWAGNRPVLLADKRGEGVDALIERLQKAVKDYPFPDEYRLWPGPNSNTFIAYLARDLPEMHVVLPPTAIGKDYLPPGEFAAKAPAGSGVQVSLLGLLGLTLGFREGIEVNVLGLVVGLDIVHPALKLPGIGRLGVPEVAE
ncbi:MAG: DUF3750 domain-containing protein [Alphaproteobacteria bacterium]|nr:DUF3750 domain-containing protein [Alphaproteobacteria bacterium]